jgi:hypothetical protein
MAAMKPLQPSLQKAWDHFVGNSNLESLHEYDLMRFAEFVRTAHSPARRQEYVDFRVLVAAARTDFELAEVSDLAERLQELYSFGRMLLKKT